VKGKQNQPMEVEEIGADNLFKERKADKK